jgi:hypothetical protein
VPKAPGFSSESNHDRRARRGELAEPALAFGVRALVEEVADMLGIETHQDLYFLAGLGLGCIVLGLVRLLSRSPRIDFVSGPLLAAGSITVLFLWCGRSVWMFPLLLGGAATLLALSRSRLATVFRHPNLQGALLSLFGAGLLAGVSSWRPQLDEFQPDFGPAIEPHLRPLSSARTDRGTPVPLFAAEAGPEQGEWQRISQWTETGRLVRTAPANLACNCHGWVFAGGAGWIRGRELELILRDNRYQVVSVPRAGDVIVYTDELGQLAHSGLVRVAADDGLMLIESKWGGLGRYVHRPDDQPYGTSYVFYRSARTGHELRGLEPAAAE